VGTGAGIKKVYVSCPSNRQPEWAMILSLQGAMADAARHHVTCVFPQGYPAIGDSLISRARNNALVPLRQRRCDFLFTMDDDVDIPVNTIWRLVEDNKDIVAGAYRFKVPEPGLAVRLPSEGPNWTDVLKNDLITPAIYVSTGCMLVKRETVEGMAAKFPELTYRRNVTGDECWALYMPFIHRGEYLSEDWAFCRRAEQAGFEVWVDGGIKCGHWGKQRYGFEEI
jgi:hypothetical protein